ncbi:MAG TPA: FkbM family methyltransferase [Chthoniobacteraceae bacterium]|nr:FkbM family methyltransferase [Chthoniobacteraceae bacterium]
MKKPLKEVRLRNGLVIEGDRDIGAIWGEIFEPAVADVYGSAESDADLIIDIGANIGSFSTFAAYTHPSARVWCFEPEAVVADQAERNFKRNKIGNVTLIRSPVTRDGREVRFARQDNRGASNIYTSTQDEVTMSSVTLDRVDFAGAKSLFLKLDCEGAEGEIIDWLIENRSKLPKSIQVAGEYHHWCPIPKAESVRKLRDAGFNVIESRIFASSYLFAKQKIA